MELQSAKLLLTVRGIMVSSSDGVRIGWHLLLWDISCPEEL